MFIVVRSPLKNTNLTYAILSADMKLDFTMLLVKKFDECFLFYRDVLGFKARWGDVGFSYASFDAGSGKRFAIYRSERFVQKSGISGLPYASLDHVMVFETPDLDSKVNEIAKRGGHFLDSPKDYPDWGVRAAHIRDPDGNLVQINSPLPKEKWSESLKAEEKQFRKS